MKVFIRLLLRDLKRFLRMISGNGDNYSWEKFHKEVRVKGCDLLRELDGFSNPVFIAGCQRSGTTALARLIMKSEGMVSHWMSRDDELDGAMILSGLIKSPVDGRHCFQTTYMNECYTEYFDVANDFKLIWVLRNPYSVVYSMHYNWGRFSFNELFAGCGYQMMPVELQKKYQRFGKLALPRIKRACYSYNGKVKQAVELMDRLGPEKMMIIDYDDLVSEKEKILVRIYQFIGLPFDKVYMDKIHGKSIAKSSNLDLYEKNSIDLISMPLYEKVKGMAFLHSS